jgi:hypothetical protein
MKIYLIGSGFPVEIVTGFFRIFPVFRSRKKQNFSTVSKDIKFSSNLLALFNFQSSLVRPGPSVVEYLLVPSINLGYVHLSKRLDQAVEVCQ